MLLNGVVDRNTGLRHILVSEPGPRLDLVDLTGHGSPAEDCDWGEEASPEAAHMCAMYILLHAAGCSPVFTVLAEAYAKEVVRGEMKTGQPWQFTDEQIKAWVEKRRKVQ